MLAVNPCTEGAALAIVKSKLVHSAASRPASALASEARTRSVSRLHTSRNRCTPAAVGGTMRSARAYK